MSKARKLSLRFEKYVRRSLFPFGGAQAGFVEANTYSPKQS